MTFLVVVAVVIGGGGLVEYTKVFLRREANARSKPVSAEVASKLESSSKTTHCWLIGDSRAAAWSTFPIKSHTNLGVHRATTDEIRWAFENVSIDAGQCNSVYIQCGINDLKSLSYSQKKTEDVAIRASANLLRLVDIFQSAGVKQIVVLGVFPVGKISVTRRPFWDGKIEEGRTIMNSLLEKGQKAGGYTFLSCDEILGDKNLFIDELHLNESAYEELNHLIKDYLFGGAIE